MGKMFFLGLLFLFFPQKLLALCNNNSGKAMVVSLSSDGRYAVSSHTDHKIILWDIVNKKASVISYQANIYSAYFIKNSSDFMWQDLANIIHIQNTAGQDILSFKNFPTYGQVMTSDLQHYFASDINWSVYADYGNKQVLMHNDFSTKSFIGAEKLLNLTLSSNNKFLLLSGACFNTDYDQLPLSAGTNAFSAGIIKIKTPDNNFSLLDGLSLWQTKNHQVLFKLPGHAGKIIGTISPDSHYIVSADENTNTYVWNVYTGKKVLKLDDLVMGRPINPNKLYDPNSPTLGWDKDNLIPVPKDFDAERLNAVYAVKFIANNNDYLRFINSQPFAILYNISDRRPIKYFNLGAAPMPSINDYTRDESIDTAPTANILIIAKNNSTGIMVYHYYPDSQRLEKTWAPDAP